MKEGTFINIRKLAALDIALHGRLPITTEFIFGVFGIAIISILTLSSNLILGVYLMFTAFNYVPILIYTLLIGKNAKKEAKVEMSNLRYYGRKYSFQQLTIFIPLAIIILSILQELQKH